MKSVSSFSSIDIAARKKDILSRGTFYCSIVLHLNSRYSFNVLRQLSKLYALHQTYNYQMNAISTFWHLFCPRVAVTLFTSGT